MCEEGRWRDGERIPVPGMTLTKRQIYRREQYRSNKAKVKLQLAAYYKKHKERLQRQNRKWATDNNERLKAYRAEYYLKHGERMRKGNRNRRANNRAKYAQRDAAYYERTKGKERREYRERNRAAVLELRQKQRIIRAAKEHERDKNNRANLTDKYIVSLITQGASIPVPTKYISRQWIECKRVQVQIHRKLKKLCQNQKT